MSNKIVGTGPHQIPLNSDLGEMAYLNKDDLERIDLSITDNGDGSYSIGSGNMFVNVPSTEGLAPEEPTVPTNVTLSVSGAAIVVSWATPDFRGYENSLIYRAPWPNGEPQPAIESFTYVGETNSIFYDSNLAYETRYAYYVVHRNSNQVVSTESDIVAATTENADAPVPLPTPPTGVVATPLFGKIYLRWDEVYQESWYMDTIVVKFIHTPSDSTPTEEKSSVVYRGSNSGFTDMTEPGKTSTYYIYHVNRNNVASDAHDPAGTTATSLLSAAETLANVTREINDDPAFDILRSELAYADQINRLTIGLGGRDTSVPVSDVISDIMAEASIESALKSFETKEELKQQSSKSFARLSGGIWAGATASEAVAGRISSIETQLGDGSPGTLTGTITELDNIVLKDNNALLTRADLMEAEIYGDPNDPNDFGVKGTISDLDDIVLTGSSALATRMNTLETKLDFGEGEDIEAKVTNLVTTSTTLQGAIATEVDKKTVTYNGTTATLEEFSTAVAGDFDGVNSQYNVQWGVKSTVNGIQNGVGFFANASESKFIVDASQFIFNTAIPYDLAEPGHLQVVSYGTPYQAGDLFQVRAGDFADVYMVTNDYDNIGATFDDLADLESKIGTDVVQVLSDVDVGAEVSDPESPEFGNKINSHFLFSPFNVTNGKVIISNLTAVDAVLDNVTVKNSLMSQGTISASNFKAFDGNGNSTDINGDGTIEMNRNGMSLVQNKGDFLVWYGPTANSSSPTRTNAKWFLDNNGQYKRDISAIIRRYNSASWSQNKEFLVPAKDFFCIGGLPEIDIFIHYTVYRTETAATVDQAAVNLTVRRAEVNAGIVDVNTWTTIVSETNFEKFNQYQTYRTNAFTIDTTDPGMVKYKTYRFEISLEFVNEVSITFTSTGSTIDGKIKIMEIAED